VLRRGKKVGEFKTSDINERELSRLMVGFAVNSLGLKECFGSESVRESKNNEILRVENVSALSDDGRMALKNVSLSINEGEILGVAGVAGNGQKELVEVIMGLRKVLNGRILLCGKDVTNRTPMDLRKMGVAYVPEDRFKFGIIPSFTIRDNLVLVAIANFSKRLILNYSKIDDFARELIFKLKINPEDPYIPIEKLSGGNLQKVILARELYSYSNKLILLHEPTAGLDVATVQFIHDQILSERKNKKAVLFVSGDLDEIFKLSDRIVVMYSGEIVGRFSSKGGFDRYRIGELMMGVGGYSSP
jgi:simple sugar transport system ATP-binding protein